MQNSPLNKAHQLQRKAEALLRHRKFDECVENHKSAAEYLQEALTMTENSRSQESLKLQADYHLKQVDAVKAKKAHFEEHRRYMETLRQRVNFIDNGSERGETLQNAICRTIFNHDSLVELLIKRGNGSDNDESLKSYSTSDTEEKLGDCLDGVSNMTIRKHEVNDATLIEEFRVLSEQLRELVITLLETVEDRDKEIVRLKTEVTRLESEKSKGQSKSNNSLRVITDSSGGTSPYVFSPCSELSPELHDLRDLPPLPSLDIFPSFKPDTHTSNGA